MHEIIFSQLSCQFFIKIRNKNSHFPQLHSKSNHPNKQTPIQIPTKKYTNKNKVIIFLIQSNQKYQTPRNLKKKHSQDQMTTKSRIVKAQIDIKIQKLTKIEEKNTSKCECKHAILDTGIVFARCFFEIIKSRGFVSLYLYLYNERLARFKRSWVGAVTSVQR